MKLIYFITALLLSAFTTPLQAADDLRQRVELPPMMRLHMMSNMRDHLLAFAEIQQALANNAFDQAADIAETRLGMTSLKAHGAEHMAGFMPKAMQDTGNNMHHAASQFAVIAQNSAVTGDMKAPLAALAAITQQCVACHTAFRVQ
ncbi:MAG: hypothetical protein QG652_862 [Pseudomonadota bacterium]|nr:hypothetical protein [Pseudomonadota bacterium]